MTPLDPSYGPLFRPYDLLTAGELTDWQRVPLFAAARHFNGLHRLYGVAQGLNVSIKKDDDGDLWQVTITKGVAFDAYGRPAINLKNEIRPVSDSDWIVLRGEQPVEQQLQVPVPAPQVSTVEVLASLGGEPVELQPWDVPLARVSKVEGSVPQKLTLDLAVRPVAVRTFRRPYFARDVLPSGATVVRIGKSSSPPTSGGWQVWVDTSGAGFLPDKTTKEDRAQPARECCKSSDPSGGTDKNEKTTEDAENSKSSKGLEPPVYLVSVGRQTMGDATRFRTGEPTFKPQDGLRAPLVSVSAASYRGFLLTVDYAIEGLEIPSATPLEIHWMGIEQRATSAEGVRTMDDQTEDLSMTSTGAMRQLPWPKFSDNERLSAFDLNDLQQTVRELQWLHNRTLHDWGVANGCAVRISEDGRGVQIEPGYALDMEGREVIVPEARLLNLPAQKVSTGPETKKIWWITASYQDVTDSRDGDPHRNMQGTPLRRLPRAVVRWRDPEETDENARFIPGLDVILATVELDRGNVQAVTTVGRRSAVPPKRPYLSAGLAKLRNWTQVPSSNSTSEPVRDLVKVRIPVDTTDAGFVSTPYYQLQLVGATPTSDNGQCNCDVERKRNRLKEQFNRLRPLYWQVENSQPGSFEIVLVLQVFPLTFEETTAGNQASIVRVGSQSAPRRSKSILSYLFSATGAQSKNEIAAPRFLNDTDPLTVIENILNENANASKTRCEDNLRPWFIENFPWQFAWAGIEI